MRSRKRTSEEAGNEELHPRNKQVTSLTNEEKLQSHNNDINAAFFKAISDGDLEFAEYLLVRGADVNQVDNDGRPPIYYAVDSGEIESMKWLLDRGADINYVNAYGESLFNVAMDKDYFQIMIWLSENGVNNNGITPFYIAVINDDLEVIKELLKDRADIHKVVNQHIKEAYKDIDIDGGTFLHFAATQGNIPLMKLLLHHGANPDLYNNNGRTPLHIAFTEGNIEAIELLLGYRANVNLDNNYDGQTPFYLAVTRGSISLIKLLLDNGANVNQPLSPENAITPFYRAVTRGSIKLIELFLDYRADVNQAFNYNRTPLHIATMKGYIEVMRLLLDHGANVDQHDLDGKTPLHIATMKGYIEAIKLLLDYDAKVNKNDNDGITPLCDAAINGNFEIMNLLLKNGANINHAGNDGRTPLCNAAINQNFEVIKFLLENEADLPSDAYINYVLPEEVANKIYAVFKYIKNPMFFVDTIISFDRDIITHQGIAKFINILPVFSNRLDILPDDMLNVINSFLGMEELMRLGNHDSEGVFQSMKIPRTMDVSILLDEAGFIIQDSTEEENEFINNISSYLKNNNIEGINIHVLQNILSYLQQHQILITPYVKAMLNGGNFPSVASSPQLMQMITETLSLRVDVFIVESNEIHSIIPTGEVTKTIKLLSQNGKYYAIIERKENLIELNVEEEEYGYEESKSSSNDNDHSSSSSSSSSSSNNAGEHDDLNLSDSEVDVDQVYHAQEANQKASSNLVYPTLYILNSLLELFKEFGDRIPGTKNFINKMISNYKENYNKYLSKEFTYDVMSKGLIAAFENIDKEAASEEQESRYEYIIDIEHPLEEKSTSDFTNLIGMDHSGPMYNLEQGPGMFDFF